MISSFVIDLFFGGGGETDAVRLETAGCVRRLPSRAVHSSSWLSVLQERFILVTTRLHLEIQPLRGDYIADLYKCGGNEELMRKDNKMATVM